MTEHAVVFCLLSVAVLRILGVASASQNVGSAGDFQKCWGPAVLDPFLKRLLISLAQY